MNRSLRNAAVEKERMLQTKGSAKMPLAQEKMFQPGCTTQPVQLRHPSRKCKDAIKTSPPMIWTENLAVCCTLQFVAPVGALPSGLPTTNQIQGEQRKAEFDLPPLPPYEERERERNSPSGYIIRDFPSLSKQQWLGYGLVPILFCWPNERNFSAVAKFALLQQQNHFNVNDNPPPPKPFPAPKC